MSVGTFVVTPKPVSAVRCPSGQLDFPGLQLSSSCDTSISL